MTHLIEAHPQFWLMLAALIGLQWLLRLVMMTAEFRRRSVLSSHSYSGPPDQPPRLSMLVAAKDEQENIESCVRSLLTQDYPNLELIVVDDRSNDETPKILRRLEQESGGRLQVIHIVHLRDGWFGKNNAMREGVETSTGEWLCFTDADCRQISTKTLSVAMQEALRHRADFLTVTPVLEMNTLWEKITQPICAQTLLFWFQPRRVNDSQKSTAYANGAFMLMKRSCYKTIGGHERVKTEVNEDIQMARFAKAAGLVLRMVENDDLYRTRMYGSVADAWRGWSRIFFGSLKSARRLGLSMLSLGMFSILPWIVLILSLIGRIECSPTDAPTWNMLLLAWAGVILVCQAAVWQFYRFLSIGRVWSLTYPLGAAAALGMLFNALFKQIGLADTTWRGTTYRGNQRVDVKAGRAISLMSSGWRPPSIKD